MSVEYFYENDLNMLYNAAVNNNPDTKMLESYNNLVTYISHIEHWKSTALQLAKNYGVRIHSLEQRIEELEQERRWIPVSESKPKSGVPVLVWNGGLHTAFWFEQQDDTPFGGHWVWHPVRKNIYTFMLGVTHWQPLPQPPQEEE